MASQSQINYKDIIDAEQFSKEQIEDLLDKSQDMYELLQGRQNSELLKGYIMASLFFEASTRTRLSFETAMLRLGGQLISTTGVQFSSMAKGESLYDTMKMVESYCDIVVIRHPVEGSSRIAARAVDIPVINAGDGAGQHPTQAILDLFTIYQEKQTVDGLTVAFIGDLKYGRTIHSLIHLLKWYDVKIILISPELLRLGRDYISVLDERGISWEQTEDIRAIWDCDVAYVTRIQEERFPDHREFEQLKNSYVVNKELLLGSRKTVSVMHPLPRVGELSTDVDDLPNALYFKQASNGVACRMALLAALLGKI